MTAPAPVAAVLAAAVGAWSGVATLTGVIVAAASDGNPFIIGTAIASVLSFGGLLATQLVKNQRAIWRIVDAKDRQIEAKDAEIERLTWERERARFRAGERDDPGVFQPSRRSM